MEGVLLVDLNIGTLLFSKSFDNETILTNHKSKHMNIGALMFAVYNYSLDVLRPDADSSLLAKHKTSDSSEAKESKLPPLSRYIMGRHKVIFFEYRNYATPILAMLFTSITFDEVLARRIATHIVKEVGAGSSSAANVKTFMHNLFHDMIKQEIEKLRDTVQPPPPWVTVLWTVNSSQPYHRALSSDYKKRQQSNPSLSERIVLLRETWGSLMKKKSNRVSAIAEEKMIGNQLAKKDDEEAPLQHRTIYFYPMRKSKKAIDAQSIRLKNYIVGLSRRTVNQNTFEFHYLPEQFLFKQLGEYAAKGKSIALQMFVGQNCSIALPSFPELVQKRELKDIQSLVQLLQIAKEYSDPPVLKPVKLEPTSGKAKIMAEERIES